MLGASALAGVAAGGVAIVLTLGLHAVQHLAFGYQRGSFLAGVEHASPLRRVGAMAAGGVAVALGWWLHRRAVDTEAVSVTRALREREHRLPVAATVADAMVQIVAVGAGASLGREGAPRQASAALAGWLGEHLGLVAARRRSLIACGAGAGLAAVYNVPVGGALFAVEVLLGSVTVVDLLAAALSSAVATVVAWPVLSSRATYGVAALSRHAPALGVHAPALLAAPVLGVLAVPIGTGFRRLMALARRHAARDRGLLVSLPVAFVVVAAVSIAFPQILGNGKGPAGVAFTGQMSLALACALVALKPIATAACLAGGAIGGLLTPAFATGAAAGIVIGHGWSVAWPGSNPAEYAIIGAATLLAVSMRAPLTAVALSVEFVGGGLSLLLPVSLAIAIAMGTRTLRGERGRPVLVRAPGTTWPQLVRSLPSG